MRLYLEDINDLVCGILDIINDTMTLSQLEEDELFDMLQTYLDNKIGKGDYKNYN